jgi:WD40 repeat protein
VTKNDGNAPILHATWSPDDLQIATSSDDKTVRIWDTRTNKVMHALKPKTHVFRAAYNSTGTQLAISAAHQLMLYNPKSAALLAKYTMRGKKTLINQALQESAPFAADGLQFVPENDDILIAGLDNGQITFCDLDNEENTFSFKSASDVKALAIAPDAKSIAAASWSDAKTTVWDLEALLKKRAVKMRRSKDCVIE